MMNEELGEEQPAEEAATSEEADLPELVEGQSPDEISSAKFSVVGIGASAGGLEAMTELLRHVLPDSMAYVVVQHLAPNHESIMAEILSRSTSMTLHTASDGMVIEANQIYVNPPNADLTISEGRIHLTSPQGMGRPTYPIDTFFRSLAEQLRSRAIGVILSGTGSDGTLGLKAIKAVGGVTFAQEPATARYDGMPRNAVESGYTDFCLPPLEIAKSLALLSKHALAETAEPRDFPQEEVIRQLFRALRKETGIDLSYYKRATINRRIERRMALNKIEGVESYVRFAVSNVPELRAVCRDVLISVTSFFRDRYPFDLLKSRVFPDLIRTKSVGESIRIWVPACATGEEVYSIAICLLEVLGERSREFPIQVFGTDVEAEAIRHARIGFYPLSISLDVSPERLRRFFEKRDDGYLVVRRVRDMVVFSTQSVTSDPPFSRIDMISCRNLLIYLQPYMQARVLRTFHYSLLPEGTLLLGTSENLGESAGLFLPVDRRSKLYVKKHVTTLGLDVLGMKPDTMRGVAKSTRPPTVLHLAERRILERYGPAGALINENWEVLQFHGRSWPYLEHASGTATLNVLKLARRELQMPIRTVVTQALAEGHVASQVVHLAGNGESGAVRIEAVPVNDPESNTRCVLVMFVPAAEAEETEPVLEATPASPNERTSELERELQQTREYLQTTIEELEASNEELKSSNEELQSANEELQSINEEIETSKEELQSTNEELTTVNDVLQMRMDELAQSNDDLSNLLGALDTLLLIAGDDHRIRRFNPAAGRAIGLAHSDLGRPLSHFDSFLGGVKSEELLRDVLESGGPVEHVIRASNQHWYKMRIAPYRTQDKASQGAIIMLNDIDVRIRTEEFGLAVERLVGSDFASVEYPVMALDSTMSVIWVNPRYFATFQVVPEQVLSERLGHLGTGEWGGSGLLDLVRAVLVQRESFDDFVVTHVFQKVGPLTFQVSGKPVEIDQERVAILTFRPLERGAKEGR